jgi:hypothetical protein
MDGDLEKQWNGIERKQAVGAPFEMLRNDERVNLPEIEGG